MKTWFT